MLSAAGRQGRRGLDVRLRGRGTVFLNAGTLAAHSGCLYLFNAPGQAQIVAVNTTFGYAKASSATGLCAYSFAAQPGDTLRRCSGGTYAECRGDQRRQLGRARSLQRRRHAHRDLHAARQQHRLLERVGDARRPHRTGTRRPSGRPACSRGFRRRSSGRRPTPRAALRPSRTRSTVVLRWECEARPARGSAAPGAGGSAAIDLGAARRRAALGDRVRPVVCRCGRERRSDRIHGRSHAARATADPRGAGRLGPAGGWWGHAPDRAVGLLGDRSGCRQLGAARLRPGGRGRLDRRPPVRRHGCDSRLGSGPNGAYEIDVSSATPPATARRRLARGSTGMARRRPHPPMRSRRRLAALAARDGRASDVAGARGRGGRERHRRGVPRHRSRAERRARPGPRRIALGGRRSRRQRGGHPGALVHGAERVCLATRLLSGAGIAAVSAGVRCAAVDELPPEVHGARRCDLERRPQTVVLTAERPERRAPSPRCCSTGLRRDPDGDVLTIARRGAHELRVGRARRRRATRPSRSVRSG